MTRAIALGAAIAALFVTPAHAELDYTAPPTLALQGTNGFKVFVTGRTDIAVMGGSASEVQVMAVRGNEFVAYKAIGTVTRRRVQANFPGLGFISIRFRPNHEFVQRSVVNGCGPEPVPLGAFRGKVRFRGEQGFTVARSTTKGKDIRGRPTAQPIAALADCRESMPIDGPGPWLAAGGDGDFLTTTAATFDPNDVRVWSFRQGASFNVARRVRFAPPAGSVSYTSSTVTVAPPAPFSGSMTLTAQPKACIVEGIPSGNLSVNLAGGPPIPLADGSISYYVQIPNGPQPINDPQQPCPGGY